MHSEVYKKKIKLLVYSDLVAQTGFGRVCAEILKPLYDTGKYDITVLAINYFGQPHNFPFPIWPVGFYNRSDPYGRDFVQQRVAQSDFDLLFMIQDSFILEFIKEFLPQLRFNNKKFRSIVYYPVDGVPHKSWIEAMAVADYPVTHTKFAVAESIRTVPDIEKKIRYIYHGVNNKVFYPLSYREAFDFRRSFFGPLSNRFIFCNVNRNQIRKDLPRTLMAFRELLGVRPEAVLYLHCAMKDQGHDLDNVCRALGLIINKHVVLPHNFNPNTGFPVEILNKIYNSVDVVISSTLGEGTGLAQLEAMACGVPVISPNNTACTELLADNRGLLVKSGSSVDQHIILPHDNEVVRPLVDVVDMAEKMRQLYDSEVLRFKIGEAGYKWVTQNLLWDKHIVPQWESIFDEAVKSLQDDVEDDFSYSGALEV